MSGQEFRRPRDFSPGYERHAAPESIKAYIAATRERQEEIASELGWLEALYLRRVAEKAAGTWPPASSPGQETRL
jgi:hypothetical protein